MHAAGRHQLPPPPECHRWGKQQRQNGVRACVHAGPIEPLSSRRGNRACIKQGGRMIAAAALHCSSLKLSKPSPHERRTADANQHKDEGGRRARCRSKSSLRPGNKRGACPGARPRGRRRRVLCGQGIPMHFAAPPRGPKERGGRPPGVHPPLDRTLLRPAPLGAEPRAAAGAAAPAPPSWPGAPWARRDARRCGRGRRGRRIAAGPLAQGGAGGRAGGRGRHPRVHLLMLLAAALAPSSSGVMGRK